MKKYYVYAEMLKFDEIGEEVEASSQEEAEAIITKKLRDRKETMRDWKPVLEADEDGIVIFESNLIKEL